MFKETIEFFKLPQEDLKRKGRKLGRLASFYAAGEVVCLAGMWLYGHVKYTTTHQIVHMPAWLALPPAVLTIWFLVQKNKIEKEG